jgi:hypothetical protein
VIQIIDCEQNSPEWFAARLGIPTASQFGTVLAKGRDGGASATRRTYMAKLAAEIVTGRPTESFSNEHTERGHVLEPEARELYSFMSDSQPKLVGFVRNGNKGASPDSFIANNGILEIKTKLPHLLVDVLLKDEFPAEHRAQCQGNLWVCEREWIDISVYWPDLPMFIKRAYRDEKYIANLSSEIDRFNDELQEMVAQIRAKQGYGRAA